MLTKATHSKVIGLLNMKITYQIKLFRNTSANISCTIKEINQPDILGTLKVAGRNSYKVISLFKMHNNKGKPKFGINFLVEK